MGREAKPYRVACARDLLDALGEIWDEAGFARLESPWMPFDEETRIYDACGVFHKLMAAAVEDGDYAAAYAQLNALEASRAAAEKCAYRWDGREARILLTARELSAAVAGTDSGQALIGYLEEEKAAGTTKMLLHKRVAGWVEEPAYLSVASVLKALKDPSEERGARGTGEAQRGRSESLGDDGYR